MTSRADRFALQFAILFLSILLAMFGLFHLMRAYDGAHIADTWLRILFRGPGDEAGGASDAVFNFTEAFRVNLFLIDLSLLLVVESILIFLFVRYTVPALLISCVGVLGVMGFGRGVLKHPALSSIVVLLTRNQYAQLGRNDAVLLVALNALLIAFLIAMMHHYRLLELEERLATASGNPSPAPAAEALPKAQESAPAEASTGEKPKEPPTPPQTW